MFGANQGKIEHTTFECGLSDKLLEDLPNSADIITVNGKQYPSSIVELHRPTGKYISRALIKLFNLFSQKGVIRIIGNTCAPGLKFPNLTLGKGIDQFENLPNKCPIIAANILGYEEFPNAVTVKGEPFMVLNIPKDWNSFEDYTSAFTSKYRVRTKKILKETKEVEVKKLAFSDAGCFMAIGQRVLQHDLLYLDVWDNKAPGIFFIHALGQGILS